MENFFIPMPFYCIGCAHGFGGGAFITFVLVTEKSFKLEVCNDDPAVKQASKEAKRLQRNCDVFGLPGVFLLLEVWEGLKKAKFDNNCLSSSLKEPNKGKRQSGKVTMTCL